MKINFQDRYHIFVSSLNVSNGRLLKLLMLLDYLAGVQFMHIASKYYPTVLNVIKRKQLTLQFDDPNLLYHLPKEKAFKLEIE